jgi:hypothetical protein
VKGSGPNCEQKHAEATGGKKSWKANSSRCWPRGVCLSKAEKLFKQCCFLLAANGSTEGVGK